jgi:hypothetical protein
MGNPQWEVAAYPKASVIICFVNEAWSALLRTVAQNVAVHFFRRC